MPSLEPGPFLNSALMCEKVLTEKDGVLSAIRIIDQVTHTVTGPEPNPPEEIEEFHFPCVILISFKAGRVRNKRNLKIKMQEMNGEIKQIFDNDVSFESSREDNYGQNIIINAVLSIKKHGLRWFMLYLDDQFLTQIPFKVNIAYVQQKSPS